MSKTQSTAETALDKIRHNYDAIAAQIILPSDLSMAGDMMPAPIFFGTLVPIANGKLLFLGEPGPAKTTLGQAVSYSTCGDKSRMKVPCSDTMSVESDFVTVDPGKLISQIQIKQKLAGAEVEKMDPSKMDLGMIKSLCDKYKIEMSAVVDPRPWLSDFGCIVIDELARAAERYQNMFLDILQFGAFKYYGLDIQRQTSMAIASSNWPGKRTDETSMVEAGTHRLVEALLNRFDISTVVPFPTYKGRSVIQDNILAGLSGTKHMDGDFDYSKLKILTPKEVQALQGAAAQITVDTLDLNLMNVALTGIDACKHGEGSKGTYWMGFNPDKCLECECYGASGQQAQVQLGVQTAKPNPCSYFYLPLGPRVDQAVIRWAKAAALLLGRPSVDEEIVKAILPYAIQARVKPTNHFIEDAKTAGSMKSYVQQYLGVVESWMEAHEKEQLALFECKNQTALSAFNATYEKAMQKDPTLRALYSSRVDELSKKLSFKRGP